jgi:hypothetical protein
MMSCKQRVTRGLSQNTLVNSRNSFGDRSDSGCNVVLGRNAQQSIEFTAIIAVLLLFFTGVLAVIINNYSYLSDQKEDLQLTQIAQVLQKNVERLSTFSDGAYVYMSLPSGNYSLNLTSTNELVIKSANKQYIVFLQTGLPINGTLCPGQNQLIKSSDYGVGVCCNQCPQQLFPSQQLQRETECKFSNASVWSDCDFAQRNQLLTDIRVLCPLVLSDQNATSFVRINITSTNTTAFAQRYANTSTTWQSSLNSQTQIYFSHTLARPLNLTELYVQVSYVCNNSNSQVFLSDLLATTKPEVSSIQTDAGGTAIFIRNPSTDYTMTIQNVTINGGLPLHAFGGNRTILPLQTIVLYNYMVSGCMQGLCTDTTYISPINITYRLNISSQTADFSPLYQWQLVDQYVVGQYLPHSLVFWRADDSPGDSRGNVHALDWIGTPQYGFGSRRTGFLLQGQSYLQKNSSLSFFERQQFAYILTINSTQASATILTKPLGTSIKTNVSFGLSLESNQVQLYILDVLAGVVTPRLIPTGFSCTQNRFCSMYFASNGTHLHFYGFNHQTGSRVTMSPFGITNKTIRYNSTYPLYIGTNATLNNNFTGIIDDILFFNTTLPATAYQSIIHDNHQSLFN